MLAKNKFFTLSCFAAMVSYAATFGLTFFMSLYLQYVMGLSPHRAGFMLLLQPVTQMVVSPLVGRITDRIAPVKVANFGIGAISIGLVLIALTIGTNGDLPLIAVDLVLIGAGFGVFHHSEHRCHNGERRDAGIRDGFGHDRNHANTGHGDQHDHHHPGFFPSHGNTAGNK